MGYINTVLGKISGEALGKTLIHEHIIVCDWNMRQNIPRWMDRHALVAKAVEFLQEAYDGGIRSLVDCTPFNLGRDVDLIKEVSEKAQINIIVSTGYFHYESAFLIDKSPEFLAELLIDEVAHGIGTSGVYPGMIKCASDENGITQNNRKLLQAACIAQKATGLPISVHSPVTRHVGTDQLALFRQEGVDLSRVILSHIGDSDDLDYIRSLLCQGCYIGMDRFGEDEFLPFDRRIQVIVALAQEGYLDRMAISSDFASFLDFRLGCDRCVDGIWDVWKNYDISKMYWKYSIIPQRVVPALAAAGLRDEQINQMLIYNPRSILENND